jgi:hypothetical protein
MLTAVLISASIPDKSQESPPKNSFAIFCVADGGFLKSGPENASWLDQTIRFVAFISSDSRPFEDRNANSWSLCIVGSQNLRSSDDFLQVASWDTKEFRFYQVI